MSKEKDNKILCSNLIICEGLDAKFYMVWFLRMLIKNDIRYEEFQAMDAGGNNDLPKFIKTLPDWPNFNSVKSITVVRDSENDPKGASQSVQSIFKNNGFAVPDGPCKVACPSAGQHNVKTGYALFPNFDSDIINGALEDLCLKTLASPNREKILGIADTAVDSYKNQVSNLKRPHKNRLHTYLSLNDDFVGLKLGESATANAFDFLDEQLQPLKDLLHTMLED